MWHAKDENNSIKTLSYGLVLSEVRLAYVHMKPNVKMVSSGFHSCPCCCQAGMCGSCRSAVASMYKR